MGNLVFQATSGGQVNLVGPNTASTFNLNVPAVAGTLVTTGDTGTVTNTMLAGSIANAKLTNSSVTVGSTSIALGATSATLDGVNIGATTAGTGAFTTLSASSTVSGTGFSTYLASPPAIGGTTAAAGTFTTLSGTTSVTTPIVKSASSLTLQSNGSTTAVTIDTSQNLLVGTTSNLSGVNGFQVSKNPGAASYAGAIVNTKTDNATVTNGFLVKYTGVSPSDGNYMFLCQDSGNTNRFYVTNAGGTGGTSDANLKKNIETTRDGYAEDLCKIRIVKYNWKEQSDDTPKDLGWIAQEVEQVFPRMIKTDADTGIKSVTHSAFVPMLIKAIQELKAINDTQAETINALTARVVALEAK